LQKEAIIDLRSDTVTQPTTEMLEAIRNAKLGDDVFREDPTVNQLQEMTAERFGKEAALLVTSGTQANLVSLMSNTQPMQLVFLESQAHIFWYEVGGISSIAGLQPWPIESKTGAIDPNDLEQAIRPSNIHFPTPSLVCIENTHNRHGGTIVTPAQIEEISHVAKKHSLKLYMDGARIFNAAVALKIDVKALANNVDNLMFCLSKGLSCPAGSLIVGEKRFIERARKIRKVLGGGMRQAGIIAAPGIVALEEMVDRLQEDHDNARLLAEELAKIASLDVNLETVQTNIVIAEVTSKITAKSLVDKLKEHGVLALTTGKDAVRFVTHYGITRKDILKTMDTIKEILT
jgi:threonine aldolase